jgi:hypothetical protein
MLCNGTCSLQHKSEECKHLKARKIMGEFDVRDNLTLLGEFWQTVEIQENLISGNIFSEKHCMLLVRV